MKNLQWSALGKVPAALCREKNDKCLRVTGRSDRINNKGMGGREKKSDTKSENRALLAINMFS